MKFVKSEDLKPGMINIKPLYDRRGVLLLAGNKELSAQVISSIKSSALVGVYVYDEYTKYEDLQAFVDEEVRAKLVHEMQDINIDNVIFLTNKIVNDMLGKSDLIIELNALSIYDHNTYEHSVNVAMMATTCGIGMGLNNKELEDLALAGMLHDIGKRLIPQEILNKQGALSPKEREIIEMHPQFGYDLLYDNNNISAYVRAAIVSHHENYDGTGYPHHLKGEEIPLYARILHVVDVYDALCRNRSYKKGYKQSESIEFLMAHCGSQFDINIVNAFLKYIVVYPVGSDVLLSDGREAHVIKNRASAIMRPVVMLEDNTILDLAKDKNCFNITVLNEVSEEDYDEDNMVNTEIVRESSATLKPRDFDDDDDDYDDF